jgi:hypothetical protein
MACSQTKILKGGTKDEMLIFDAPFNGVNALFLGYEPLKNASNICISSFVHPFKSSFGSDMEH